MRATHLRHHVSWAAAAGAAGLVLAGCSVLPRPGLPARPTRRAFTTTVTLHGKPLELHLSAPRTPTSPQVVVLYATGDGGWFGTAVDMFRQIADAGYSAVGFSSRAFLRIDRALGQPMTAAQLSADYGLILAQARAGLGLSATTPVVLAGWSRGAAFSVLVGSEATAPHPLLGVVAIGLSDGEDLEVTGADDDTDDGRASAVKRRWPFDTYERIAQLQGVPCALIQASRDNYLPAADARRRFGPDSAARRFYAIDAVNHRFSGGKAAFQAALLDALRWMISRPPQSPGSAAR